jgi:2-polyprenyl-6-methoxyphenol hydroxylase-like FAD-dependent oxidoreductase
MERQASAAKQAVVIGGSLGGLFAGLLLRSIRWDVDIYERWPQDLDSRGGGRAATRSSCGSSIAWRGR